MAYQPLKRPWKADPGVYPEGRRITYAIIFGLCYLTSGTVERMRMPPLVRARRSHPVDPNIF